MSTHPEIALRGRDLEYRGTEEELVVASPPAYYATTGNPVKRYRNQFRARDQILGTVVSVHPYSSKLLAPPFARFRTRLVQTKLITRASL